MILEKGNMWDVFGNTDLFLITTNPIIRADGAVVMGRGIAKQVKDRFPTLPFRFAERLTQAKYEQNYVDPMHPVCIGTVGKYDNQLVGWFMVKRHWQENAEPDVIENSVRELSRLIKYYKGEPFRVDLNFPGIGNGKLKREDVLPIIEKLPNNVHVWEYGA